MSAHKKKYKIGLTFGAFDMFHIGHLNLLRNAKELLCERLIVCVSSDAYIYKVKGHAPIVPFIERLDIVRSVKYVDEAGEQTLDFGKKDAVKKYKPDVLIVGNDWNSKTYSGEGLGIPVEYLPYTNGTSSTVLREKLLKMP